MKLSGSGKSKALGLWAAIAVAVCSAWGGDLNAIELPKAGINLAAYNYWGTSLPFFDVAHMADRWRSVALDGTTIHLDRTIAVNALGYPTALAADEIARSSVFTHNGEHYPLGQYVLRWSGKGAVRLQASAGISVVSQTPGQIIYNVAATSPGGLMIELAQTDPSDPVQNIGLHAPLPNGSGAFNAKYKADLANYGVIRTMDWNQTNNHPISSWVDRTTLYDMHWGGKEGVPYEAQIQLANDLKEDLWLTVPHLADDDYVRKLAILVSQRLSPELRVWVEYSNEVWNASFQQHAHANDVLRGQYGVANLAQAYGKRASQIFDIFQREFPEQNRVVRVVAGQTANATILDQALVGATVGGSVKADVAAVAPYFTVDVDELYQRHLAGTVNIDEVFTKLRANLDAEMNNVAANRQIAGARGLPLVAYEAGQHLVPKMGAQQNDAAFVDLLSNLNRDPRMGEVYTYFMEQWYSAGGKTLVFYNDTGNYSKWGSWGLKESYSDDTAPKFNAVQNYLQRLKRDAADFNKDGKIDLVDYQTWRLTVGSPILHADANGDGVVDKADYVVWRHYYDLEQRSSGNGSSAAAVIPEPATLYMTVAGICLYSWPALDRRARPSEDRERIVHWRSSLSR